MRADSLPGLTETGRRALVDYGVSLVVNLRPPNEEEEALEPLPVPVVRQAMDPRPVPAAWDWPSMREAYLALADRYRAELAQALTILGNADPPAAIHCAGGRDRITEVGPVLAYLRSSERYDGLALSAAGDTVKEAIEREGVFLVHNSQGLISARKP